MGLERNVDTQAGHILDRLTDWWKPGWQVFCGECGWSCTVSERDGSARAEEELIDHLATVHDEVEPEFFWRECAPGELVPPRPGNHL